jgi:hypothetical protein
LPTEGRQKKRFFGLKARREWTVPTNKNFTFSRLVGHLEHISILLNIPLKLSSLWAWQFLLIHQIHPIEHNLILENPMKMCFCFIL